jgi:NAD(P)-dependent dehydrogenase (short-subunit alcohol dehydrogenase family)
VSVAYPWSAGPAPDDPGLESRVAIVTGGGAAGDGIGNGRAAAILLARAGTRVLVVDLDEGAARRTAAMVADGGGEAVAARADVTSDLDCAGMVQSALDRFGRLDVLVNNVGISSRGSVVTESQERWEAVMRVNVSSMMLASRHAIPAMISSSGGGAIINISSISALRPRGLTAYSASKGAVIALTQAMAVDHGPDGIRVNCVAPGPVYTPMVQSEGMTEAGREQRRRASVLGLEGTGWDIGNAVVFLASNRARYVTGHVLVVDGGVTLASPARDTRAGQGEGPGQ